MKKRQFISAKGAAKKAKKVKGGDLVDDGLAGLEKVTGHLARKGPSPSLRKFLSENGDTPIQKVWIGREPIDASIRKVASVISSGLEERLADEVQGYDEIFHLWMMFDLGSIHAKIHKEEVVRVQSASAAQFAALPKGATDFKESDNLRMVKLPAGTTLNQLFDQAVSKHGEDIWNYNSATNNCQKFVVQLLEPYISDATKKFVMQDAGYILNHDKKLISLLASLTNIASTKDTITEGYGLKKKRAKKATK